jgi:hypothetical protein
VAKQRSKLVQALLTTLATDPELLMEFIKTPDRVLDEFNIEEPAMRQQIRNHLALEVAKKILAVPCAAYIHWGT